MHELTREVFECHYALSRPGLPFDGRHCGESGVGERSNERDKIESLSLSLQSQHMTRRVAH